jgi:DNA-binding NarL/FixJ family response regulator
LLVALRRVLAGGVYLSEAMEKALGGPGEDGIPVAGSADPIGRLSNRELQVLSLIGRGLSSRQAAESLNVSVKTVESHRQSLKRKLNLATNAQLLQYSVKWFASRSGTDAAEEPDEGSDT